MDFTLKSSTLGFQLSDLQKFLHTATQNTYASEQVESQDSENSDYKTLRYSESDWEYEDMYTGFFRSWGSESIRHKGILVWKSNYGGGMINKYIGDLDFATETFNFLKLVMRSKPEDTSKFYLRGPEHLKQGEWEYTSETTGDITAFNGEEQITYKQSPVFFHQFLGGLVIGK